MQFIGYCLDGLHTQLGRAPLVQRTSLWLCPSPMKIRLPRECASVEQLHCMQLTLTMQGGVRAMMAPQL